MTISTAYALDDNNFKESHDIYMSAVNGDKSDVRKAAAHFDNLNTTEPFDRFVEVYKGSIESLMATHVYMPWNKMKHAELGSELMDDAIDEISESHDVTTLDGTALSLRMKLVAAHTYFRFPKFMNRYQDAKDLVADILESTFFSISNTTTKNSLYQLAAEMAKEDGDTASQKAYLAQIQ